MLAVAPPSPGVSLVFFIVAVVLLVLAAVLHPQPPRINLMALGLAFFVAVFAWNSLAAI